MRKNWRLSAAATVLLTAGAAQAQAPSASWQLDQAGSVNIAVPSGHAMAVGFRLSEINDRQGRVASFRLDAYRNGQLVESQRFSLLEPGGTVSRHFSRPFDRVQIADAEGWVSATVGELFFCATPAVSADGCATSGPSPVQALVSTSGSNAIAGNPLQAEDQRQPEVTGIVTEDTVSPEGGGRVATGGAVRSPWDRLDRTTPTQNGTPGALGRPEGPGSLGRPVIGQGPAPERTQGQPFHGERTPISRIETIRVQGGPMTNGNYRPSTPWIDQAKLSTSWRYLRYGREEMGPAKIKLNDKDMPLFPAGHQNGDGYVMYGGPIWFGTNTIGSSDVAGTWQIKSDRDVQLSPRFLGPTVVRQSDTEVVFACEAGIPCRVRMEIREASKDAKAPTMIQLTDASGAPVGDVADHAAGLVTRSLWRKANYGYTDLRLVHESGASAANTQPIRYDHFPSMDSASWSNQGFWVPFRMDVRQKAKDSWSDLMSGTGMRTIYSPTAARLKAAFEIGAVYHHNFPYLFLENRQDFDPAVIGQWAVDLWRRSDISEEKKLSLLNDYELQHVDQFGADVVANQQYLINNQVKLEVANETWNYAWPYVFGNRYFERKAARNVQKNGWGDIPAGVTRQAVQTGYDLTKTIARLRKKFPQVEWRGVMAVHTGDYSAWRRGGITPPDTPTGAYNRSLLGLMYGYQLFWDDYAKNRSEWSQMYAAEPAKAGDWFEAHGTTYYSVQSQRSDMKTHLGGYSPEELAGRAADRQNWPALRREMLAYLVEDSENRGALNGPRGTKTGTSSLFHLRRNFETLKQHADAYGMQVLSYEGGSHADMGTYYKGRKDIPEYLIAFWRDFHDSTEFGLIQAAVHNAAVDAGWIGLADYQLFQGETTESYIFGTRKHFDDVTPRFCEYARWMPAERPAPEGLSRSEVVHPHTRCGGLVDYLNQAKANGYYVNAKTIPEASSFLQN